LFATLRASLHSDVPNLFTSHEDNSNALDPLSNRAKAAQHKARGGAKKRTKRKSKVSLDSADSKRHRQNETREAVPCKFYLSGYGLSSEKICNPIGTRASSLCRFCKEGKDCTFAHVGTPAKKWEVCRFFMQGQVCPP
jgi:hypothetical protein